jgi:hypothetical protein
MGRAAHVFRLELRSEHARDPLDDRVALGVGRPHDLSCNGADHAGRELLSPSRRAGTGDKGAIDDEEVPSLVILDDQRRCVFSGADHDFVERQRPVRQRSAEEPLDAQDESHAVLGLDRLRGLVRPTRAIEVRGGHSRRHRLEYRLLTVRLANRRAHPRRRTYRRPTGPGSWWSSIERCRAALRSLAMSLISCPCPFAQRSIVRAGR